MDQHLGSYRKIRTKIIVFGNKINDEWFLPLDGAGYLNISFGGKKVLFFKIKKSFC